MNIGKDLAILLGLFLATFSYYSSPKAEPENTGTSSPPSDSVDIPASRVIGNIKGIQLSIPQNYLVSNSLRYEGESQIMARPRTVTPTFESPITRFVIRLRLSTLKPLEALGDSFDLKNTQTRFGPTGKLISSYYDTWTNISISPEHHLGGDDIEKEKERWLTDEGMHGPFKREDKLIAGLVHEESVQPAKGDLSHYEYFYNEATDNTFIVCQSGHSSLNDMSYDDCSHWFIVPELKVVAEAIYTKKDLPRWREIEKETRKRLHSFIVQ